MDFFKREVFETEDGTSSLRLADAEEQFHSLHGAVSESMHIYITAGLKACNSSSVNILEAGFGTGLNAVLTLMNGEHFKDIHYDTVEKYPLSLDEVAKLNYENVLSDFPSESYLKMHTLQSGETYSMASNFHFQKHIQDFGNVVLPSLYYDVVYFDMFNPDLQPELWTEEVFAKVYASMKNDAILVTYCAKGRVKRALKSVGFELEALPGPVGKREITRAKKKLY